jgi:hypothetical protein
MVLKLLQYQMEVFFVFFFILRVDQYVMKKKMGHGAGPVREEKTRGRKKSRLAAGNLDQKS